MAFRQAFARLSRQFAPRLAAVSTSQRAATHVFARRAFLTASIGLTGLSLAMRPVHLDALAAPRTDADDTVVDPATSIVFPKVMKIPATIKIEPLTLVGVGVRTVSFLGIKVYSVGFYADLNNPSLKVPADLSPEEKLRHIVQNTACVIRIVPTRTTSFTHLRDAFMRALNSRLSSALKDGHITEEVAQVAGGPLRKLKSLFPNSPLNKHTPLDVFLSAPQQNRARALVFRELGTIENDWVATEFVLHYFAATAPSPALKESVLENLKSFQK